MTGASPSSTEHSKPVRFTIIFHPCFILSFFHLSIHPSVYPPSVSLLSVHSFIGSSVFYSFFLFIYPFFLVFHSSFYPRLLHPIFPVPSSSPRDVTLMSVDHHPTWMSMSWQPPKAANGLITGGCMHHE